MKNFILITIFLFSSIAFGQATKLGQYDELTTNDSTLSEITVLKNIDVDTTGGVYLPSGTTAERPTPSKDGLLRYNNQTDQAEIYANGTWLPVGGGISNWITAKSYLINDVVIENQKIYQCITNHTSGTFATDLVSGYWEEVSGVAYESTGLISGGILSIDTDTTKFDISSHELGFTGDFLPVSCPALNAQTVTNIASADTTYILVDDTCAVTQQTTFPTPQDQRLKAFIGRINHPNRTTIQSAFNSPNLITKTNAQLYDFFDSIGPFNKSGNIIYPNGANLSINRSSGVVFRRGINYSADSENPHEKTFTSSTVANLFRSTQNAIGTTLFTTLDVANYDNAGTVTAVGGGTNSSTNQRVYLLASGNLAVQYGQTVYSSLANAVAAISNESFTPNQNILSSGVLVGVVSCTRTATAANNDSQCVFSKVSRFDSSGVSAGSNSVATLQSAYNNSITPQITTSTALGPVDIRRGSVADTDNIFRGQNGSGSTTFSITGNGAVTASGAITGSNLSGTNTGDLTTQGQLEGSAVTTNKLDAPYNQLTTTATGTRLIETGNPNFLANPSFEAPTLVGWTCSTGTCTRTTVSGEFSHGTAAVKIVPASNTFSFRQNVSVPLGVVRQGYLRFNYKIPSTCPIRLSVQADSNTSEVPNIVNGMILDNTWRTYEVPILIGPNVSAIELFKDGGGCTASEIFFDNFTVASGLGLTNLQLDTVYSAQVSSAGVVSGENKDWINGNCSILATGNYECSYISGLVTQPMNCVAISGAQWDIAKSTNTNVLFKMDTSNQAGNATASDFSVICQKSGNDYLAASASVYSAASADFGYTNAGAITITATTTNPTKGTVVTDRLFASRDGQRLIAEYQYQQSSSGSAGSGDYLFTLPYGLSFDSSIVGFYTGTNINSTDISKAVVGYALPQDSSVTSTTSALVAYDATRFRVLAMWGGTNKSFINNIVFSLGSAQGYSMRLNAPIQGWSQSNYIVGSFQGYNYTPNVDRVETFSVSYGTTNASTVCSASPCSYLDQIGNAVTSVTRGGTGIYDINFSKTYSKIKCTVTAGNGTANLTNGTNLTGTSVNKVQVITAVFGGSGVADSYGTLVCQGIPQ